MGIEQYGKRWIDRILRSTRIAGELTGCVQGSHRRSIFDFYSQRVALPDDSAERCIRPDLQGRVYAYHRNGRSSLATGASNPATLLAYSTTTSRHPSAGQSQSGRGFPALATPVRK